MHQSFCGLKGTKTVPAGVSDFYSGGADGIRTHDPHVANVMLSQLSYCPTAEIAVLL